MSISSRWRSQAQAGFPVRMCLHGRDTWNGVPGMYEMQGPRPAWARQRADDSAAGTLPGQPPDLGHPPQIAGCPASLAFPEFPRRGARLGGERCSTATPVASTRRSAGNSKISLAIHRTCGAYPPSPAAVPALSTASCTGCPASAGRTGWPTGRSRSAGCAGRPRPCQESHSAA